MARVGRLHDYLWKVGVHLVPFLIAVIVAHLCTLSLSQGAHLGSCLMDLFGSSLTRVEVLLAVCLPPASAGPGQVATRVHPSLMLSPWPSLPPSGTEGHPPVGSGLGWPELSGAEFPRCARNLGRSGGRWVWASGGLHRVCPQSLHGAAPRSDHSSHSCAVLAPFYFGKEALWLLR